MTKTFKILSTISFIAMAIVLTFVGVWALTDLDFTVGGDITYTAPAPEPVTPEEVSYLTFEYYEDLTAKLMSCSSSAPQVVEIPAQIEKDGKTYTVTSIKEGYLDEMDTYWDSIGMFSGTSVKEVVIPDTVTDIGNYAFIIDKITKVTIGSGVTNWGWEVFTGCQSLQSVIFKDGLTSIGYSAFYECDVITNIEIPDSVSTIMDWAIGFCDNLTSVTIGSGATSIGYCAFNGCNNLAEVNIKATTPPTVSGSIFTSSSLTIYVPTASVDAYKSAAGWSEYADKIVGKDFN